MIRSRLRLHGGDHGNHGLFFDCGLFLIQFFQLFAFPGETGPSAAEVGQAFVAILRQCRAGRGCFVRGQLQFEGVSGDGEL